MMPHLAANMKVGLLGGSFNPAHEGHRALSLKALNLLGLDTVVWLVARHNPHKPLQGMASFSQRLRGAQKMARHPHLRVSGIEGMLSPTKPCFSYMTVRALQQRWPRCHFVWLMGQDSFANITSWKNWRVLVNSVPVAVFPRGKSRQLGKAGLVLQGYRHHSMAAGKLAFMKPPAWILLSSRLENISSTSLRNSHRLRHALTIFQARSFTQDT